MITTETSTPAPDPAERRDLKTLSRPDLVRWLGDRGIAPYRADQIHGWIYGRQADTFDEMTDLKKEIRALLSDHFTIDRLRREALETAADGTRKLLFRLTDGEYIETVLIPERDHYTLCLSTQVGCAQGCRFCLTAAGGFVRNLTAAEIIAQVRDVAAFIDPDDPRRLSNLVFMGMGEPLANYDALISALAVISDNDHGLRFSTRRVTVSTAGLVPKMADLGRDTAVNLAVSLNATEDRTRDRLMPINRRYPLDALIAACRDYPLRPHRRITFEYILIRDVNDTPADARRLVRLLRPIRAKVNLIPFNEHPGGDFRRPDPDTVLAFQKILIDAHYTAIIRKSKGADISAACGQLRGVLGAPGVLAGSQRA